MRLSLFADERYDEQSGTLSGAARDCLRLANTVPAKDRVALLEMASEWERLADQQLWATDLGQREQQIPPNRPKRA